MILNACTMPSGCDFMSSRSSPRAPFCCINLTIKWGSRWYSILTDRRSNLVPQASKDFFKGFSYPPMTKNPRWWWRTLSCLPYLLPLHQSWIYAETAYNLHPFLEAFESWTTPFLEAVGRLPRWSFLAYFVVGYLCVVRRQEWPHFFRFHMVMGLLLEIALHVTGALNRVTPGAVYWGKIGMHFWTIFFFGFLFTVLDWSA